MLLGQFDPGLHGDGESCWGGVVGDVFVEEGELASVM